MSERSNVDRTAASEVKTKVFPGVWGQSPQRALEWQGVKIGEMQFSVITIPATGDHETEEELNRFLRGHRVVSVRQTS